MNPKLILPAPDALPLPAPAPLLFFLLQLTWLLHLLAMNAMLGGLLITLWSRLRGRGPADPWTRLADTIAGTSPTLVAATVTLGVAPLLFLQTLLGPFFYTSSILMGWGWFSIIVLLIFGYYGTYQQSFRGAALGAARIPLLGLTTLIFLWVGFMFTNNTTLMLDPGKWAAVYFADPRGLFLNLDAAQLWPRYLHMVCSAVAVAGLMLAWWGKIRSTRSDRSGAFLFAKGYGAFVLFTSLNILLGLWYYLAQPGVVRKLFMGGDTVATGLFGIGMLFGILIPLLWLFGRRKGDAISLWPATGLTLLQLVTMVTMRDIVRGGWLAGLYQPDSFTVETQWLNLGIFVVLLLGGIATLVWMIRTIYRAWDDKVEF